MLRDWRMISRRGQPKVEELLLTYTSGSCSFKGAVKAALQQKVEEKRGWIGPRALSRSFSEGEQ